MDPLTLKSWALLVTMPAVEVRGPIACGVPGNEHRLPANLMGTNNPSG